MARKRTKKTDSGKKSGPPEADIRRRFAAGLRNVFGLYRPLVDEWSLYDASRFPPRLIATEKGGEMQVAQATQFDQIRQSAEEMNR